MSTLLARLQVVRERIARYTQLVEERSVAEEAARALLAQDSTYPRPRRVVESELLAAEMDLRWIRSDLSALVSHERILEAELGGMMAEDLELAAAEAARAAKAAKAVRKKKTPPSRDNLCSSGPS